MARTHMAVLVGFTLAAGACDESATHPSSPALPEKPAFNVGGMTLMPLAGEGEAVLAPEERGPNQAAIGGYASGHYEINPAPVFLGTEKTEFIALATEPLPTAKGELEHHATAPGFTAVLHADIDCVTIVENQAYLSGPIERYEVNGEPLVTTATHVFIRVVDNGEGGNSPPDLASQLHVFPTTPVPPNPCEVQFQAPLYPSVNGDIQVKPDGDVMVQH